MEPKVNMHALYGRFAHSFGYLHILKPSLPSMTSKNPQFLFIFTSAFMLLGWMSSCQLQGELELIAQYQTKVPEASGMTMDSIYLYVVSDQNGDIYKLDLQGNIIEILKTKTKDVEGITLRDTQFYLVDERKQKLYTYDLLGNRIANQKVKHPKIYDPANGLEGVVWDSYTQQLLILHEKKSGQIIRYDRDLKYIGQTFLGSYSDYSAIATTKDHIWIISDEASGLAQYNRDMDLIKLYSIGIDSPEGITIDEENGLIYVVSDTTGELVVFRLPNSETAE